MNITELDLDLDGWQAMLREEMRQRAWRQRHRHLSPVTTKPLRAAGEARRTQPEPAWD